GRTLWRQLIEINRFPPARFILRHWITQFSTHDYKMWSLRNIAHRTPYPLVLVGDDTEHDPEIFVRFAKRYGKGRVAAILIRRTTHRTLPKGVRGFYSAFDMALHELEAGRILPVDVLRVGRRILDANRPDLLFPDFAYCPTREL